MPDLDDNLACVCRGHSWIFVVPKCAIQLYVANNALILEPVPCLDAGIRHGLLVDKNLA